MNSRDKMQVDKKTLASKLDEDNDERRKEIGLLKAHVQKEREEMRAQVSILCCCFLLVNQILSVVQ